MEPIVSPVLVYLIGTVGNLKALCFLVSVCTWVWIILMYATSIAEDDKELRPKKYVLILAVILLLLTILIPSKETLIAMAVSSYITPDNVIVSEQHIIDMITRIKEAVMK